MELRGAKLSLVPSLFNCVQGGTQHASCGEEKEGPDIHCLRIMLDFMKQ